MAIAIGQDIGKELIEVLGLGKRPVKSIEFRFAMDEAVTVKVEYLEDTMTVFGLLPLLETFNLVPKEE